MTRVVIFHITFIGALVIDENYFYKFNFKEKKKEFVRGVPVSCSSALLGS